MPANVKYVLINRSKGWTITPFVFFWGGQLDNPCQSGYRLTSQEDQGYTNLVQGCPHLNHTCTPLRQSFYIQTLLFRKHSSKQTNKQTRQQLRLLNITKCFGSCAPTWDVTKSRRASTPSQEDVLAYAHVQYENIYKDSMSHVLLSTLFEPVQKNSVDAPSSSCNLLWESSPLKSSCCGIITQLGKI